MQKTILLIIAGIILFVIGISILAYEIFGDSDLQWTVETEVSIIFYVLVPGMIISGIGVILEFAKRKWI